MDWKLEFGILGFALMMPTRVGYLRRLVRGHLRTHSMTWTIWGVLGGIAFAAQTHGGGAGLINTGSATTFCFVVAVVAFVRGDREFTRGNWVTLAACGAAASLWVIFDTPLWSVCAATTIDVLGYLPVLSKAWRRPHDEGLLIFVVAALTWTLGTAAITQFGVVTTLYPVSVAATNALFAAMIVWRRREVPGLGPPEVAAAPQSERASQVSLAVTREPVVVAKDRGGPLLVQGEAR